MAKRVKQSTFEIATLGVRAGTVRSQFNEHSEGLFLTSSFVFENAAQAAERFTGGTGLANPGFVYSRFTNPTVSMFQDRLAALEGAEACVATASGMSAILATSMALLKAGDHVVCSNAVFGATVQLFVTILSRFGIETTFVSPTKVEEWQRAVRTDRPSRVGERMVRLSSRAVEPRSTVSWRECSEWNECLVEMTRSRHATSAAVAYRGQRRWRAN